eukprot:m.1287798 g.1287798  ORF g.1287798 m.1287798 type:complete len:190 (+) comp24781_c0_seq33:611-1180(+)
MMPRCLHSRLILYQLTPVTYYLPYSRNRTGFHNTSLLAQAANGVVNFLSTFIAFFLLDKVGRRSLLIAGGVIMTLAMALLATLGTMYYDITSDELSSKVAGWACIICVFLFVSGFAMSWGPVVWLIPTEIFPTSQRARGVRCVFAYMHVHTGRIEVWVCRRPSVSYWQGCVSLCVSVYDITYLLRNWNT